MASSANNRFQRKPMSDFQYLAETAEPSSTATTVLFIIGALLAIGLKLYFIESPWRKPRPSGRG